MGRKSVLLLAKTGYIIRDLLLGKFAQELVKDFDLIVAVPNPEDSSLEKLTRDLPVTLIPFNSLEKNKSHNLRYFNSQHWIYRFKQIEMDNPSLEIVTRQWEPNLSGKKLKLVNFMRFSGKAVNKLRLMGFSEGAFLSMVGRWEITRQWVHTLEKLKPSAVVSTMLTVPTDMFTPSVDIPVVLAARKLGIPCGTLVQSWDNLSSKTYVLPTWLERYWTWSAAMSAELVHYNPRVHQDRILNVGSPHFDYHLEPALGKSREAFMKDMGLDPKRLYILIGTGVRSWLPHEPDTVLGLAQRLKAENPALQVLLRLHPKDDGTRWAGFEEALSFLGVVVQKTSPAHPMDPGGFTTPERFFQAQINSIKHAAVVINWASSLTVDAAILNRPVISVSYDVVPDSKYPEGRAWFYNNSEHFGALVETGGVWVVRSEEECVHAIHTYLEQPHLHADQRAAIVEKVTGRADGKAGSRLADEVTRLVIRS